jgi:hypothetical protein
MVEELRTSWSKIDRIFEFVVPSPFTSGSTPVSFHWDGVNSFSKEGGNWVRIRTPFEAKRTRSSAKQGN